MTSPSPRRYPCILVVTGVLSGAALFGSAAALADAGRLGSTHLVAAPLEQPGAPVTPID